jgi:hypothetical protein
MGWPAEPSAVPIAPFLRQNRWVPEKWLPLAIVFALLGCGDGPAAEVGSDASVDAGIDRALPDVGGIDAAPEASADVIQDTSIPPLTCSGEVNEPNDKEVLATFLGSIDDCDGSGSSYSDVLAGVGDIDWYRYTGTSPTNLCFVDPTVTIDTPGLRLCEFALCTEGTTSVTSCTNGSPATSPAGTGGCCTTSTTAMTMKITCSSLTNAADIYVRVDQPPSNTCTPYNVAYHY